MYHKKGPNLEKSGPKPNGAEKKRTLEDFKGSLIALKHSTLIQEINLSESDIFINIWAEIS